MKIAKCIQADYSRFKSFVIIDSYHYMEYVATGVSMMCKNLGKLVIFTGGIDQINEPNSSSATSISQSLFIASSQDLPDRFIIPEVTVYHNGFLLRANRTIKTKCKGSELFGSPNYPVLASTINHDTTIYWENVKDYINICPERPNELQLEEVSSYHRRNSIEGSSR